MISLENKTARHILSMEFTPLVEGNSYYFVRQLAKLTSPTANHSSLSLEIDPKPGDNDIDLTVYLKIGCLVFAKVEGKANTEKDIDDFIQKVLEEGQKGFEQFSIRAAEYKMTGM